MKRKLMKGFVLWTGLLPAALFATETPGGVSISPVRIDMAAHQHAAAVTVSNAGSDEKLIQVEPMQWTHPGGSDQYTISRELVVNPPLFRLPPGGSQVVRIGLARQQKADATLEKCFRLFFQELPQGGAVEASSQLKILLRIGVPVFIGPLQPGSPDLAWQLIRAEAGQLRLQVNNKGTLHERVSGLSLNAPKDDAVIADLGGFAYVLPGEARHWDVSPSSGALPAGLVLHAVTERGAIHAELPLPAP